jgi:hypothetical protein
MNDRLIITPAVTPINNPNDRRLAYNGDQSPQAGPKTGNQAKQENVENDVHKPSCSDVIKYV